MREREQRPFVKEDKRCVWGNMLKKNEKSEIKCKNSDVDAYLQIADAKKGFKWR